MPPIPLLSFIEGVTRIPAGYERGGIAGAAKALAHPHEEESAGNVDKLAKDTYGERMAIRGLVDSGQAEEAFGHVLQLQAQLRASGSADGDIAKAISAEAQMARTALVKPSAQGTPTEQVKLATFLGGGAPKDVRESARAQSLIGASEATAANQSAQAQFKGATLQPTVEKLGAEADKASAQARYNDERSRGGAGGDNALRRDLSKLEQAIASHVAANDVPAASLMVLNDQANAMRRKLGLSQTQVNAAKGGGSSYQLRRDPSAVPAEPTDQGAAPAMAAPPSEFGLDYGPTTGPGNAMLDSRIASRSPTLRPAPTVPTQPAPVEASPSPVEQPSPTPTAQPQQRDPFADIVNATRTGQKLRVGKSQLRQRLIAAGVTDPAQQETMIQQLLQRVNRPQ